MVVKNNNDREHLCIIHIYGMPTLLSRTVIAAEPVIEILMNPIQISWLIIQSTYILW